MHDGENMISGDEVYLVQVVGSSVSITKGVIECLETIRGDSAEPDAALVRYAPGQQFHSTDLEWLEDLATTPEAARQLLTDKIERTIEGLRNEMAALAALDVKAVLIGGLHFLKDECQD